MAEIKTTEVYGVEFGCARPAEHNGKPCKVDSYGLGEQAYIKASSDVLFWEGEGQQALLVSKEWLPAKKGSTWTERNISQSGTFHDFP